MKCASCNSEKIILIDFESDIGQDIESFDMEFNTEYECDACGHRGNARTIIKVDFIVID